MFFLVALSCLKLLTICYLFVLLLLPNWLYECLVFSFIMKALFFHNLFKNLVTNLALCVVSFSSFFLLICSCLFCLCFKYIYSRLMIVFQSILFFNILPFYFVTCLFMCVSLHMSTACMWRSKDNLWEFIPSTGLVDQA